MNFHLAKAVDSTHRYVSFVVVAAVEAYIVVEVAYERAFAGEEIETPKRMDLALNCADLMVAVVVIAAAVVVVV